MENLKLIKKLNERLASFERQGLTEAYAYKQLQNKIQLLDLPITKAKNGNLRISRSKKSLNEIDTKNLEKLLKIPTLKEERKKLKSQGIKNKMEQNERLNASGKLRTWSEENLDFIYQQALSGNEEAQEIVEAFQNGDVRHMKYNEVERMIKEYEREQAKSIQELYKSSYYEFI